MCRDSIRSRFVCQIETKNSGQYHTVVCPPYLSSSPSEPPYAHIRWWAFSFVGGVMHAAVCLAGEDFGALGAMRTTCHRPPTHWTSAGTDQCRPPTDAGSNGLVLMNSESRRARFASSGCGPTPWGCHTLIVASISGFRDAPQGACEQYNRIFLYFKRRRRAEARLQVRGVT